MSKTTKEPTYDWVKPGDRGRYGWMITDNLLIDHSYQRDDEVESQIHGIASKFSWVAFNTVTLMEREGVGFFVVDGQQRLKAVKRLKKIKSVPCRIFQSDGPKHEAKAYRDLNINRRNISAASRFKAAVREEILPEFEINNWLGSIGMHICSGGPGVNGVDYPAMMISQWRRDEESCKNALLAQRKIIDGEPLHGDIQKGFWWLFHSGIDVWKYADKIIQSGGRIKLLGTIRAMQIKLDERTINPRLAGLGILGLINHKLRNKVKVPVSYE